MTGPNRVPLGGRVCPFCGVATDVPHETQAGCIAALHDEIGRMRGILAHLKPANRETADGESPGSDAISLTVPDRERCQSLEP